MRLHRSQRGLAAATIVIVLLLALVAFLLGRSGFDKGADLDQQRLTEARLARISDALVEFASLNKRLPCPAAGTASTGVEDAPAAPACGSPDGVPPWVALGLRREDATDGWGRGISYRVYAPTDSSDGFTRQGGVDASNCNTEVPVGVTPAAVLDCASAIHSSHPLHFLRATLDPSRKRGLVASDRGVLNDGLAFVLISHGASGRGAFGAESGIRAPAPASAAEVRNTQGPATPVWSSPFVIALKSDASVVADDAAHFDDVVSYMTAGDLISRARLSARAWPTPPVVLDQAGVAAVAIPGFDPAVTQDTGRSSVTMGGVTIGASSTLGTQNIGFRERDGVGGIGVIPAGSAGGGSVSSTNAEKLTFNFGVGSAFRKVDIAFNEFRIRSSAPLLVEEQVEISFWRDGAKLQATAMKSWMGETGNGASDCLFELAPGNEFDLIEVRPLARTGDGGSSSLTIASFKACTTAIDTASCVTTIPGSLACPIRPPSAGTAIASGVAANSATLNGVVNAMGATITASFDYGPTIAYGSNVASMPAAASGASDTAVLANVSGLACNTTYHYRANAVGAGGTTAGNDMTFTTPACP